MINEKIFFQAVGSQELVEFCKAAYKKEAILQKALEDSPEVIAGFTTTGNDPTRLLLIKREMKLTSVESGGALHIDHLYADTSGIPVLVEVKRSSDLRLRREVVAQMLDYAANAAQEWTGQVISDALQERAGPNKSVDELLHDSEITMPGDQFISAIVDNLANGRIRMMFVADEIPESLRRIIEFLNTQMSPAEILGVEVPQYKGPAGTAYVPRLVGRTTTATNKKLAASGGQQWDRDLFLEAAKNRCPEQEYKVIVKLLDHADTHGTVIWGQGEQPGFGAWYKLGGQQVGLWNLRAPGGNPKSKARIEFRFSDLLKTRGHERVSSAATELEKIHGAHNRIKAMLEGGLQGWPSIYMSEVVNDNDGLSHLFAAISQLMSN
jgi:hypothetical protein